MRKILFLLTGLLFMLAGCSDGGSDSPDNPNPNPIPTPEETASITCSTTSLSLGYEGGEKTLSFTTNKNWTISIASGISWCTISQTAGSAGAFNVSVKVLENQEYDERNVTISIKCDNATHNVVLTQKQKDALLITTNKYEVDQTGGIIEVEVKANIDYQVQIAEASSDWIKESSSRGLSSHKHSFTIAESEEYDKREGEIHFKSGNRIEAVKVYQTGGAILVLSKNEYTVSDKGETISVELKSNTEYGVQMPDVDWITDVTSSRGISSHTLKYVVSANETYDSRSAEIIFYDKNSDLKDTLKIVQVQKDAIIVSKKEYEVINEGETIEVRLSTNVNFEVTMPDVDWVTQINSRALTENILYFKVTENITEESRSAEIIFTNTDSQLSEKIMIVQKGIFVLQLVNDEYTVSDVGETIEVEIKSNIEYGILMPDVDWITQLERSVSTDKLKFIVSANETYDNRSAEIIFFDRKSDLKDTLKVLQTQKNAILILKNEYTISAQGGTLDFEVNSNVDYTIDTSVDWIKQFNSRTLNSKNLHFIIDENIIGVEREGAIIITYGELKQTVIIRQEGLNIPYITFTADAEQALSMSTAVETLEYSVNGSEWKELGISKVEFGGKKGAIRLRGKNINGTVINGNIHSSFKFNNSTPVICSGDIRTLLDYNNHESVNTANAKFQFLFYNCSCLISAPKLPAMILADECYYRMFTDCINLIQAPELPAIELSTSCYAYMFDGCINLKEAPKLPAISLRSHCYYGMFANCTNLCQTPELPATTVAPGCYQLMFSGCTNLNHASRLPATTLATSCYSSMFKNCKSLIKAPELLATNLAMNCCEKMFYRCTALKQTPKILPATTLAQYCYKAMFYGCNSLIQAPELPATELDYGCYASMFANCNSLTEVPNLPATELADYCYSSMFADCISLIKAPDLPATELADYCYSSMFKNCTSLIKAPELPATYLTNGCYASMFNKCSNLTQAPVLIANKLQGACYEYMFYDCKKLNFITMLATDIYVINTGLNNWVEGVCNTGTFVKAKSMNSLPNGYSGIPEGWTVVDYEE